MCVCVGVCVWFFDVGYFVFTYHESNNTSKITIQANNIFIVNFLFASIATLEPQFVNSFIFFI